MSLPSIARTSPTSFQRPRLLVVDDNDTTRHLLTEIFLRGGYQVDQASDGLAAMKRATSNHYDAIVLDLVMPNLDGWQFRQAALRNPELAKVPTVIVTVRPLREEDRYALRADYVIRKPFDPNGVLTMVERACHRRGADEPMVAAAAPAIVSPPVEEDTHALLWSTRGEVACTAHAPRRDDPRWAAERWNPIPPMAGKGRITYQCQLCAALKSPIQRGKRAKV